MKDYVIKDIKKDNKNDIKDIGIVKNMMAQVLEKSYSPYSKFKVGAILYTKDDTINLCRKMCIFKSNIKWGKKK